MRAILITCLLMQAASVGAQIGAGRWLLAGNGMTTGNNQSTETISSGFAPSVESRNWSWRLSVRAGYFLSSNWAVGLVASQGNSGNWYDRQSIPFTVTPILSFSINRSNEALRQSSVGLFARRYQWLGAKQRFGLFAEATLSYRDERRSSFGFDQFPDTVVVTQISRSEAKTRGLVLDGAIGAVYRVNDWLGLEVLASLGSLRYSVTESSSSFSNSLLNTTSFNSNRNSDFQSSFSPSVGTGALTVGFQFYLGRGGRGAGSSQ